MSNQGDSGHDSEVDEREDPESISDPEPETEESHNDSRLSRCWFFEGTMNLDLGSFELDGDELPDIGQLQEYFGGSNCYKTAPLPPIRITYMHILANLAEAGRGGMFYTKFIGPIRERKRDRGEEERERQKCAGAFMYSKLAAGVVTPSLMLCASKAAGPAAHDA